MHLSRDGGQTWRDVTPPELPEWALISIIEPSPHDPATAYLAATRYKLDDLRPTCSRPPTTARPGSALQPASRTHDFTRAIRDDPEQRGLLYAGTETGLYVSFDDGAHWQPLQGNLPVVPIHDLVVKDGDLIAATHGRSFWVLDDLAPLRQLAGDHGHGHGPDSSQVRLFQPGPVIRYKIYSGYGNKPDQGISINYRMAGPVVVAYRQEKTPENATTDRFLDAGRNPPGGAVVTYYLPSAPVDEVTLTVLDAQGGEIRRFTSTSTPHEPAGAGAHDAASKGVGTTATAAEHEQELRVPTSAGMNRFVWNLRCADAHKVPGDKSTEELLAGPIVPPGRYEIRLTVSGQTHSAWFELRKDPRVTATEADLQAQYALLLLIRDKLSQTHDAIIGIRDLREQAAGWAERAARQTEPEPARSRVQALQESLTAIEDALIQVKAESPLSYPSRLNEKLAVLATVVDSADAAPTTQSYTVFSDLSGRIDAQLARLREVINTDVGALNTLIRASDLPGLVPMAALTALQQQ